MTSVICSQCMAQVEVQYVHGFAMCPVCSQYVDKYMESSELQVRV
jgi:transcription elongation factor Elf1